MNSKLSYINDLLDRIAQRRVMVFELKMRNKEREIRRASTEIQELKQQLIDRGKQLDVYRQVSASFESIRGEIAELRQLVVQQKSISTNRQPFLSELVPAVRAASANQALQPPGLGDTPQMVAQRYTPKKYAR